MLEPEDFGINKYLLFRKSYIKNNTTTFKTIVLLPKSTNNIKVSDK